MKTYSTFLLAFVQLTLFQFGVNRSGVAQNEIQLTRDYLSRQAGNEKVDARDITEMQISSAYLSPTTQWYHIYFDQTYRSIRVYNSMLNAVLKSGDVVYSVNNFVDDIEGKALLLPEMATVNALSAVKKAASEVSGLNISDSQIEQKTVDIVQSGRPHKLKFTCPQLSEEDIVANLFWVPNPNSMPGGKSDSPYTLAWIVQYLTIEEDHSWNVQVDAVTGAILDLRDDILRCDFGSVRRPVADHMPITDSSVEIASPNSYHVFDYPVESPLHGSRTIVSNPYTRFAPATTGPGTTNGWHNDGTFDYTYTRGNNVFSKEDVDRNNSGGSYPSSATLEFNYPYSQTLNSSSVNQNAAITNLFYWNNILHDVLYRYGFDEPSGNFQANNMGRGGLGNDYIFADAQDGLGINNATFSCPPDGFNGRMQMYLWNTSQDYQPDGDFDNGVIAHEYGHGWSIRLTGGPATSSCLNHSEQGGEGWSDYLSLMMTTNWSLLSPDIPSANLSRGIGNYVLGLDITDGGIRPYPYSYDIQNINPAVTYGAVNNLGGFPGVHGVGSIWATVLWDMTWEIILQDNILVNNIYDVPASIQNYRGNVAALKLVHEGLKLQPCTPNLLKSRDAIMAADELLFGGRYKCAISKAFSRRGFGLLASTGFSSSDRIVTEDFTSFADQHHVLSSPTDDYTSSSTKKLGVTVSASNKLLSSKVTYEAGEFVVLTPGFQVDNSNVFQAFIGSCLE